MTGAGFYLFLLCVLLLGVHDAVSYRDGVDPFTFLGGYIKKNDGNYIYGTDAQFFPLPQLVLGPLFLNDSMVCDFSTTSPPTTIAFTRFAFSYHDVSCVAKNASEIANYFLCCKEIQWPSLIQVTTVVFVQGSAPRRLPRCLMLLAFA
eukprot:TRINITY_DN2378_c1_g1_i1.p1 TRINITY_DN2378_c1_g1~~TRINITY_DN2378_c1_g1_i1.p1  ORF type:complete len:148 (+),score=9.18 TRINITY_DN2378_c1_g1_i1:75-518(+)